ncbi:maltokinase N-terminal cap-like domain-containing protein [Vulgatibacter sp.]|uniref:maltokinase N-terminal cap-like domain-containing protein n=1 Tax=Vulgatibacter sp. TaxID=1971226 RepID=UPI0035629C68
MGRPWFQSGSRQMRAVEVTEAFRVGPETVIALVRVEFAEGAPETYVVPLAHADGDAGADIWGRAPNAVVCHLQLTGGGEPRAGVVFDALADAEACRPLLRAVTEQLRQQGNGGELVCSVEGELFAEAEQLEPRVHKSEHGNGAIAFGDRLFLTLFRRLGEGMNPALEIGRALVRSGNPPCTPPLLGALEYGARRREPFTVGVLHTMVASESDGRQYTREAVGRYLERIVTEDRDEVPPAVPERSLVRLAEMEPPLQIAQRIGPFLDTARQLGRRVGELHVGFAGLGSDPAFAPEPYSAMDQRSTYQTMRNVAGRVLRALRAAMPRMEPDSQQVAQELLARQDQIYERFAPLLDCKLAALRGRIHGDLNLGRFLFTGREFYLVDFEGDRTRSLVERRRKRSPLRDVATMIRSFHRVAITAMLDPALVREGDRSLATPWADAWGAWTSAAFLGCYLETARSTPFVTERAETALLLDSFSIEHLLWELGGILEENPQRADVAMHGLLLMLEAGPGAGRA